MSDSSPPTSPPPPEIEAVRTRYFLATFNLILVIGMAGVIFNGVVFGPGAGADRMSDGFLSSAIVIFGTAGGLLAVGAWVISWLQWVGLRQRHAMLLARDRSS